MKKYFMATVLGMLVIAALPAQARNVKYMLPIKVSVELSGSELDPSIKLFYGPQAYPKSAEKLGELHTTNKASIADSNDTLACNQAFASALQDLQKGAKSVGANAVVNIATYFKGGPQVKSATEFECHAGSHSVILMTTGDFVRIGGK